MKCKCGCEWMYTNKQWDINARQLGMHECECVHLISSRIKLSDIPFALALEVIEMLERPMSRT